MLLNFSFEARRLFDQIILSVLIVWCIFSHPLTSPIDIRMILSIFIAMTEIHGHFESSFVLKTDGAALSSKDSEVSTSKLHFTKRQEI